MSDELQKLRAENALLRGTLLKCKQVLTCDELSAVFVLAHVHGMDYKGPSISPEEIDAALNVPLPD